MATVFRLLFLYAGRGGAVDDVWLFNHGIECVYESKGISSRSLDSVKYYSESHGPDFHTKSVGRVESGAQARDYIGSCLTVLGKNSFCCLL